MHRPLDDTDPVSEPALIDADRSARSADVDAQVRDLMVRSCAQERVAKDAQPRVGDFFRRPTWSMDTGLTAAQERFVEHWSPQRILADSQSVRQLVRALRPSCGTQILAVDLNEMLSTFASLQAR